MPSHYSVVQYVPDAMLDERINIGVIVFDGQNTQCRFLSNWRRVRHFSAGSIEFLHDFQHEIQTSCVLQTTTAETKPLTMQHFQEMTRAWIHSIQFTPLRGSLLSADELLEDISRRFLREPQRARRPAHNRRAVALVTARAVKSALRDRIGEYADHYLQTYQPIQGRHSTHPYDVSVSNGRLYFAAQALSFERQDNEELQRDIELIAWSIKDVRESLPAVPLAVVVLPPSSASTTYQNAIAKYQDLEADVVEENEVGDWAKAKSLLVAA